MADNNRSLTLIKEVEGAFQQTLDQNVIRLDETTARWDRSIYEMSGKINDIYSRLQQQTAQSSQIQRQLQQIMAQLQENSNSSVTSFSNSINQPVTSLSQSNYLIPTRLSKIDLPNFDGDNVEEWIYSCELFFTLDNTPKHMKVIQASSVLEGRAFIWHKIMEQSNSLREYLLSRETYVKAIIARFGWLCEGDFWSKLMEIKQQVMVEDYLEYLRHKLLFRHEKEEVEEEFIEEVQDNIESNGYGDGVDLQEEDNNPHSHELSTDDTFVNIKITDCILMPLALGYQILMDSLHDVGIMDIILEAHQETNSIQECLSIIIKNKCISLMRNLCSTSKGEKEFVLYGEMIGKQHQWVEHDQAVTQHKGLIAISA